jgi:hypothetical protein
MIPDENSWSYVQMFSALDLKPYIKEWSRDKEEGPGGPIVDIESFTTDQQDDAHAHAERRDCA